MNLLYMIIPLLMFFQSVGCQEADPLKILTSLEEEQLIQEYQGKEIVLRGFIYSAPGNRHFISSEPNLKSCCLTAHGSLKKAIEVEGLGLSELDGSLIALKGILYIDTEPPHSIHLMAALPAEDGDRNIILFAIALLSLFLIGYVGYRFYAASACKEPE